MFSVASYTWGIGYRSGDAVESSVITARSPNSALLLDHVKGARPGGFRRAADAHLLNIFELLFGLFELVWRQAARVHEGRWSICLDEMENTLLGLYVAVYWPRNLDEFGEKLRVIFLEIGHRRN